MVSIRNRWDGTKKPHIKLVSGIWLCSEFTQFSHDAKMFCLALNIKRM